MGGERRNSDLKTSGDEAEQHLLDAYAIEQL